jgi:hypothetical protein
MAGLKYPPSTIIIIIIIIANIANIRQKKGLQCNQASSDDGATTTHGDLLATSTKLKSKGAIKVRWQ